MNKFAYDTLGTSRELEAAGMERRQAEAVAIAIARREGNLATKSDLKLLRTELKSDISKIESELKSDISRVESELNLLRTEVKSEISEVKSDISEVKSDITEIRSDMKAQFRWVISMQIVVKFAVIALVYANGT